MPIKKKLADQNPTSTPAAPRAKRVAPKAKKSAPTSTVAAPVATRQLVYTPDLAKLAKEREAQLGPPLLPQELPGAAQSAASVVGQTWTVLATYRDPPAKVVWVFFKDGTLGHDKSTIGLWRQQGAAVVIEVNGRYAQYKGVISGGEASGEASNIVGKTWTWTATIVE